MSTTLIHDRDGTWFAPGSLYASTLNDDQLGDLEAGRESVLTSPATNPAPAFGYGDGSRLDRLFQIVTLWLPDASVQEGHDGEIEIHTGLTLDHGGEILRRRDRRPHDRTPLGHNHPPAAEPRDEAAADAFAAARWFDGLWNSTARATSPEKVEWQCTTWGSGRGTADWTETALFVLVAEIFSLQSWRNREARDELVVSVPVARFREIERMIDRVGEDAENWPWLGEEDPEQQIQVAAEILEMPAASVADNDELLEALRIE